MKILYYIETVCITTRTHFLRIHLSINGTKYKAIARVMKDIDNPKCRKLIWRGKRPTKLTEEVEEAIKKECAEESKRKKESRKEK